MLRKIIFWSHLAVGLVCAAFVAIMSFTGAALALEKEIVGWAERDARRIEAPPAGTARLPLEQLVARARDARPDLRIVSLTVAADPRAGVALGLPNNATLYANPFTGELREASAPRARAFMQTMRAWHTRLNFTPTPGRPSLGAQLNAAANTAFVFLCVSGLVLWWPRTWTARVLRPSLWFVGSARGKARDWNWHNVIGFWTLPLLFVMAASGVVLSYRWAGDLVFRLAGETPPALTGRPAAPPSERAARSEPPAGLAADAWLTRVAQQRPTWESLTLRFNPPLRADSPGLVASNAILRTTDQWPPFFNTTLAADPQTGELRTTDAFTNLSIGMRARRWIRLLHTGEAFRWPGEVVAGLGCLGACVLVWTGLALSWRRFFGRA